MSGETINKQSSRLMVDRAFVSRGGAGCCYRLQKFEQNGRRLYCSYQLNSNFQLFIFS